MKSKKFMLAGLVLLAITMVLLPLSGCKNDSVPETPKYQVTFDVGGNSEATAPEPITVESGAKLTAEQVPALPDTSSYQFMGWYLGDTEIKAGYTVTKSVTMTARWQGWLTFTAEGEQSLTIRAVELMEIPDSMVYSTDGGKSWRKPEVDIPIPFGNGTKLYLRAKSSIGTAENVYACLNFLFGTEVKVACSGDIRTLVDYTNPTGADTSNARFPMLFVNCSQLTQAPKLPAEILADQCYHDMFAGCTSLTQAPELPAATLADDCYYMMFRGCTSLTQAPKLPAENLADNCYYGMFSSCTSLTEAPELPAKILADNCYQGMFYGCKNLNSVTMLATDVSASDALYQWLDGTAADGTLYVASGMKANETIEGSLPTGWTVEVAATN